jgi:hypothetical protein
MTAPTPNPVHEVATRIERGHYLWRNRSELVDALVGHLGVWYDAFRLGAGPADLRADSTAILVRVSRDDERVHVVEQLTTAAADEDTTGLIVVTTRAALVTLPGMVAGKPLRTILLPRQR